MTLDKAIKELLNEKIAHGAIGNKKEAKAFGLGIEALKLIDNLRFDGSPYYPNELPGETKD